MDNDLEKLLASMKAIENRIHMLRLSILKNEEEQQLLNNLKVTLEDNIDELKKAPIAMAAEFRKAKEDLHRANLRMSFLKMDRLTLDKAFSGNSGVLELLEKDCEKMVNSIQNNVFYVDFGRKNGNR